MLVEAGSSLVERAVQVFSTNKSGFTIFMRTRMSSPTKSSTRRAHPGQVSVSSGSVPAANSPLPSPLSRRLSLTSLALSFSSSSSSNTSDRQSPSSTSSHRSPVSGLSSPTTESTPRGGFSELFNVFKRDRAAVWFGVQETDDIKRLDLLLSDRDARNEIVMELLAAHSDYVLPMRFIATYAELLNTTDRKERQMKGRKILSTFFQPTSVFHLKAIPEEDLHLVKVEHFGMVKIFLLSEMVKIPMIAEQLATRMPADIPISSSESETASSANTSDS